MPDERIGLPQGTLDLLILKVLSLEPQHGWAISERLQQISTKQAARSPPVARDPGLPRNVLKRAVPLIVVKAIAAEVADAQIVEAVPVEIADCHSLAE
jgi:hypothetical protein